VVTLGWHIRSTSTLCSSPSDCHFRITHSPSTCSDGPSTHIDLKFPALQPHQNQRNPVSDQHFQLRSGNTAGWISLHRTKTFLCFSSSPLAPQQAPKPLLGFLPVEACTCTSTDCKTTAPEMGVRSEDSTKFLKIR
jgi:hypothetical protein